MTVDLHPSQRILLELINSHRFATSNQLTRHTQHLYGNRRSAIRQTLRHLQDLKEHRYTARLERRIGGWQGGSQTSVWTITTKGHRYLTGSHSRIRPQHYSTTFLQHYLAVAETRVVLHETTLQLRQGLEVQPEPLCWRQYLDHHGQTTTLKPDLMATITSEAFVDRYFFEIDRATENPARVIRKCWQYLHYQRIGIEQQQYGVYPAVVWLVPNEARQRQLRKAVTNEPGMPRELFLVITVPELPALIRDGPQGL